MVAKVLIFLAGILSVQQLSALPDLVWLPVPLIGLGILIKMRRWSIAAFVIGVLWAVVFATFRLDNRLPENLAGRDFSIQGVIADLPEYESTHSRFNFTVTSAPPNIPDKLRLTWYYPDQTIKAGQSWAFTVRLKPPHGNFNPGGFDYERWLLVEDIGASGYIRAQPQPVLLNSQPTGFNLLIGRQRIVEKLDTVLINSRSLPMIKALTVGDGNSLTPEQWDIFRQTGTTHLMVISGSHIGLITALVYIIILKLWARTRILAWSPQQVAAISAMIAAIVYAGLTGFSVPAQRSALMLTIAMLALIQQRNTRPYHILALALLAVLAIDPLVVLLPGFWLSFIAVSLIIYVLAGRLEKPGFIRDSIKINWVTSIGLTPIVLFYFQQMSLIAPIANFIAVPVISLIVVPLALLATLILFIYPVLATKLFVVVDFTLQGLWWILVNLADLPLATLTHPQPSWWALCFAIPGILLMFAPKGMPARWLGLVMLMPLVFTTTEKLTPGTFKLTLLDVGQGLSAVVQTANHALVYDTGAKFSATSDSGKSVVIPFLRSQAINKLDTLIVSHGDNDHTGGTDSLVSAINTERIITSVPEQLSQYSPAQCQSGQSWLWDDVSFTMLSPNAEKFIAENDNSCVLLITAKTGSALLSGDIEAAAESWLVESYHDKLKADILIAPHHGSQTSSTANFLTAINPEIVLIPAGYRNQFGHPHEEVLNRYRHLPVDWLISSDEGAIITTINKNTTIETWRKTAGKYWNYNK